MATHSSILAWKIPWTEEPGRIYSIPTYNSDLLYPHISLTLLSPLSTGSELRDKCNKFTPIHVLCCAKSLQSCSTVCNLRDHSPRCSSVHGILQARTLEWLPFPIPTPIHGKGQNMHFLSSQKNVA